MTQKQVVIEYLMQRYPEWVVGELMNGVWVEVDGERQITGFRGRRNCNDFVKKGLIETAKNDKGFTLFRYKPEGQTVLL